MLPLLGERAGVRGQVRSNCMDRAETRRGKVDRGGGRERGGGRVAWFIDSLHLLSHTHRDHELVRPRSRRPPRPRKRPDRVGCRGRGRERGGGRVAWFMENLQGYSTVHWNHEQQSGGRLAGGYNSYQSFDLNCTFRPKAISDGAAESSARA